MAVLFCWAAEGESMNKDKSGNWFSRHKVLTVILAFIVVGAIAAAAGGGKDDAKVVNNASDDSSKQASTDKTPEKTQFKVDETISFDGKEVTVSNVERNWDSGNQFVTPDSGSEFVKVQVTIKNTSDDQISYNTFDWKMKNSAGVIKDVDSTAFMVDGGLNSGELAAGGEVSGFLVFQVPTGDSGLVLQYSPSFWTDKKLEVTL